MRYLGWLIRILLFVFLLGFAVKNDQPVTLRYFFGFEWESSLVIVLLAFFALGCVIGVLAMLADSFRQRREISQLKSEIRVKDRIADTQRLPIQSS